MENSEYSNHFNTEDNHWWFIGQRKILTNVFEKYVNKNENLKIVDAGCGTGRNIIELQKYGEVIGIDYSETAIEFCKKRGIRELINRNIANTNLPNNSVDVIISVGVFYHKDINVKKTLQEFSRILKKNGTLIIMTPANEIFRSKFLKTSHDTLMHTGRRHNLTDLSNEIKNKDFSIIKKSYYTSILFLPAVLSRFLSKIKESFKKENSSNIKNYKKNLISFLLKNIMFIEAFLIKRISFPFGVSLLIVCKKK